MAQVAQMETVFERLLDIMRQFEGQLVVKANNPENYYLDTPSIGKNKKPVFFGAVQVKKNYVGYYLMPVYVFPELLNGMSDKLAKRMQGKSCFNFKVVDAETLEELDRLTHRSFEQFVQAGYVKKLQDV